jgi:ribulose 1,5-bisphosphate synthetase/thiazole synthase
MDEVDDYMQPIECDVAIIGAEMSAFVAAAILAKQGRRVVVVDSPPVTGGAAGRCPSAAGGSTAVTDSGPT